MRRILFTLAFAAALMPAAAATQSTPPKPTNLRATVLSGPRVQLTWDAPLPTTEVRSWVVYRNGFAVGTAAMPAYTDERITGGGPFVYVVQARDASGNVGPLSDPLSVSLGVPPPAPPPLPPPLTGRPPVLVAQPRIAGRARPGSLLVARPARWSGARPLRISYQWLRCRPSGGACANVTGATRGRYRIKRIDIGFRFRVVETARNAKGIGSAASAPTPVVRARR